MRAPADERLQKLERDEMHTPSILLGASAMAVLRACVGFLAFFTAFSLKHDLFALGLAGTAVRGLRLAGGVGDYSVRVYAGNRDQVTRRYAQLFDRHRNPLSDEFQQEKRTLEGLERYLVQLWRELTSAIHTRSTSCMSRCKS